MHFSSTLSTDNARGTVSSADAGGDAPIPALAAGQPEPRHVAALDGLRGLAVLMVMCTHLFFSNVHSGSPILDCINHVLNAGWMGVDLFFVLSGFLITRILFVTREQKGYFKNFYARRTLRIFPLYYGVLLGSAAVSPIFHFHWHGTLPWYLTYSANLRASGPLQLEGAIPSARWLLSHFWSLQVEEQFYLLWPAAVFLLASRRRILAGTVVLSLAAFTLRCILVLHSPALKNPYWPYAFTPCRMDSLLIGAALSLLWFSRWRPMLKRLSLPLFVAIVLVLLAHSVGAGGLLATNDAWVSTFGFTLTALASACLITMALSGHIRTTNALLRFFGRYSYGLYVFHFPLAALWLVPWRVAILDHTGSRALALLGSAFAVGAVSTAVAWLSYQLYERRFLELKRHFSYARPARFA